MSENSSDIETDCASSGNSSGESAKPTKTPTEQLKDHLSMLIHASQCEDPHCTLIACEKMKIHINHCNSCEYQTNGGCSRCRTLFVLCSYHARDCQQANCAVINCSRIRAKMEHRRNSPTKMNKVAKMGMDPLQDAQTQLIVDQNVASLLHGRQCHDAACAIPTCSANKTLFEHTKTCQVKSAGGCSSCQQFVNLCCDHAKDCKSEECMVPFCSGVKRVMSKGRAENDASPPSDSSDDGPPEVDVSLLERKNYVTMLVLAMCPSADLQNDEKTRDLNVRAWKMEEEIFGMAINDSEYRKMIIDKVQSVSGAK